MNEPGEQLFACAALSQKQYGGIARSGFPGRLHRNFHPPTRADDQMIPIATFFRENFDFPLQRLPFDGLADDQLYIISIERPSDEIVSPSLHYLDCALDGTVGGYQDHRRVVAFIAKFFKHFETA